MRALLGFARWLGGGRKAQETASALARTMWRAAGGGTVEVFLVDPGDSGFVWCAKAVCEDDAEVTRYSAADVVSEAADRFSRALGADMGAGWLSLERPEGRIGLVRTDPSASFEEDVAGLYNELVTLWFEGRRMQQDAGRRAGVFDALSSSVHVFVLGPDDRLVWVSEALASLTGRRPDQVLGRPVDTWIGREWASFHRAIERVRSGIPTESFEAELPGLGGVPQEMVFFVRRSESGVVFGIGFPVRKLESMGRVAMQTARLSTMAQIASGLLAELDDPVTSIKVHAEALRERLEERWGRKQMVVQVDDILAGVERLARLAGDLVSYAHSFEEEPTEVSINALCEEALGLCHGLVLDKKARVRTALAGVVPHLIGSAGPLRQALVNVLTNALQALDGVGGSIVIRSWDNRDGTVSVSISDTGVGMDEEAQERLFEPFFTTRHSSGLGMTLVRDVVFMHGGSVEVDSEPGEGTVVTITLPVGEQRADALAFNEMPFDEQAAGDEVLDQTMDSIVTADRDEREQ